MGTSFTNDIILIEERYTFNFSDCTITNLKDLAENASFKEACEIFPRPQITYADKGNRIEVASGDKKTMAHIYDHRIDLIYVYDEPQLEENGLFGRVKERRVRSFFESFRKRLLAEKVLTFGPPKGPMAIEAEGPGSRKGKHTLGHHVYQIDFT